MSLVSVIIPSYNPSDFLIEATESVFNQSYKNIEVILINDGSSEASSEIYEKIKQQFPEIKIINFESNRGVAFARNTGIENAKGEYIAFLDQDDFWSGAKIEQQVNHLSDNKACDFVTSRQKYFLASGVDKAPTWVKSEHINVDLPGFLPGSLMARVSAFDKIGKFDESLKAGTDDVDWFFRAKDKRLNSYELSQPLLFKRIHQDNLSKTALIHNKELLSVVRMNLQRKKQQESQRYEHKISVIIPCYNAKKFILDAIKTVEDEGDIIGEIIVVDDASADGSVGYIESLKIEKLKLIKLPKNKGISAARNEAVNVAKFPYIAFLDADDLWVKGRSNALAEKLKENKTPWAFGSIEHFSNSDKYILPATQTGYFASSMLVETDFFIKVGLFNEELKVGEFIEWFDRARSVTQKKPAIVNTTVLKRRIHGDNSSLISDDKNKLDYLKVARAAIARKKQS